MCVGKRVEPVCSLNKQSFSAANGINYHIFKISSPRCLCQILVMGSWPQRGGRGCFVELCSILWPDRSFSYNCLGALLLRCPFPTVSFPHWRCCCSNHRCVCSEQRNRTQDAKKRIGFENGSTAPNSRRVFLISFASIFNFVCEKGHILYIINFVHARRVEFSSSTWCEYEKPVAHIIIAAREREATLCAPRA